MSIIHVQQIESHLKDEYLGKIDMSDQTEGTDNFNDMFLTRSLAAYSIRHHSENCIEDSEESIIDGSGDNGIDAIYYHEISKILYISQSKWIKNGSGEPSNGDVKKFIAGIHDLFSLRFERFNEKLKSKEEIIRKALRDPNTKYQIILTYTGVHDLSEPSRRDFDDLLDDFNDASEIVYFSVFNQKRIHPSLIKSSESREPIDIEFQLRSFGKISDPLTGYYGQVNGTELWGWWDKYRNRLFQKNIRGVLGDTQVNNQIFQTLRENPSQFWYFNNGITIICDEISKSMAGGASTELGQFTGTNISIVNGAQTVSTLGKFGEDDSTKLDGVFVPVRVIMLKDAEEDFDQQITKANNTQNRIETRDFVSFDPEQKRIRDELLIEKCDYRISRGEFESDEGITFDIVESASALACASGDVSIVVQLKREIGKFWENLEKPPYKTLYNPSVSGRYIYNCVRTLRIIDQALKDKEAELSEGRDQSIIVNGNRFLSFLIFNSLDLQKYKTGLFNFDKPELLPKMKSKVDVQFLKVKTEIDTLFPNSILINLFKNGKKVKSLFDSISK
jgi:hypothetical protein